MKKQKPRKVMNPEDGSRFIYLETTEATASGPSPAPTPICGVFLSDHRHCGDAIKLQINLCIVRCINLCFVVISIYS